MSAVTSFCRRSELAKVTRKIRLSTSLRNRLSCEQLEVLGLVAGDDACVAKLVGAQALFAR